MPTGARTLAGNPYLGLRPFDEEDAHLFFGRQKEVKEVLGRLEEHRFVGVVGLSGSGKSSLVRSGVIPALRNGELRDGGVRWRIATFRPGADPMLQLDEALDRELGNDAERSETLRRSSFGLIRATRAGRSADENLLVFVDQFEEIFRTEKPQTEDFVRCILTALQEAQPTYRIYVVLTMRTDYIGDCAQFRDLPEALNDSLYLVPRMTVEQRREAIEGPAKARAGEIDPQLLQQLLFDTSSDPDHLPILQHLLMRMWQIRKKRKSGWKLTLDQYQERGGWKDALNQHGKELLDSLPKDLRAIAKRIFQRVTELGGPERDRRRLTRLSELARVCSPAKPKVVRSVVEHFRRPGSDFLTSPDWTTNPDPLVDITHESLIRQWAELNAWAREEAEWGDWYRQVEQRTRIKGAYLAGGELSLALRARERGEWHEAWASRYVTERDGRHPPFTSVIRFLEESKRRREDELSRLRRDRKQALDSAAREEELRIAAADALGQLKSALRTGALLITTEALPSATVGKPYSAPLRVTGGQPPFQWTLGSGKVSGLRLSKRTGILSGSPKAPGPFVLFVRLRDAKDKSATAFIKLNVLPQSIERHPSPSVRFLDPEIPEKDAGPILTLGNRKTVMLVNMVPRGMSGETGQDSEPFLAVHPNGKLMVAVAYTQFERGVVPHYLSMDGGWTWRLRKLIPFNAEYSSQTYAFSGEGNKLFGAVARLGRDQETRLSVLQSEDPSRGKPMTEMYSTGGTTDQPFLQAVFLDRSRIYVGGNNFSHTPRTATLTLSTDGGASFRELVLESRSTAGQDGPAIRPSISRDGTAYSAFMRWRSTTGSVSNDTLRIKGDIVICRDDAAAGSDPSFTALCDPSDSKPGRIIAANRSLPFSHRAKLGQQRLGGDLSVAADPNQSATVYVAWSDLSYRTVTLHVRRSTDRGETWSDDLLSVASAINPAIAVSEDGVVGCLYQQHVNENWETHFRKSGNGDSPWSDTVLVRAPSRKPAVVFQPYIGRTHLTSAGGHFYGVFSASNDPNPEYFPEGVHFQRRHRIGKLLNVDGTTPVAISIDPYFFDIPS
jgi:hypothetical protein